MDNYKPTFASLVCKMPSPVHDCISGRQESQVNFLGAGGTMRKSTGKTVLTLTARNKTQSHPTCSLKAWI